MFVNLLPRWFLCKHFLADGGDWQAGRGGGGVCSKDASSAFIPAMRVNAIAANAARMRRGSGTGGRRSNATGRRRRANRNVTGKAGATGNASRAGNHQSQKQLTSPRG